MISSVPIWYLLEHKMTQQNFQYIAQEDEMACGLAALAMVMAHYGPSPALSRLRQLTQTNALGTTAYGVMSAAQMLHFDTLALQADQTLLTQPDLLLPFIAHVRQPTGELGRTYALQIQILQLGKLSCRCQHLVVCGLGLLCSSHHRRQASNGTKKLPKDRQLVFGWAYSRIASIIIPPTINVNPNSWLGVGSACPRNMRLRSTENTTSMDCVASTAANSRILCAAS